MATIKLNSPNVIPSASPWGKTSLPGNVVSFNELMSEEYVKQLKIEDNVDTVTKVENVEDNNCIKDTNISDTTIPTTDILLDGTENDILLAQMLQLEFDRENDSYIKSKENQKNGSSKVSISYQNFSTLHPYDKEDDSIYRNKTYGEENYDCDDSDEEEDFEEENQRAAAIGRVKGNKEIITKHDSLVSERRNAKNVELFPLNFPCGNVSKKDIRLPNHVYNKLKVHSKKAERNEMRLHDKKEHSTHEGALDENTRLVLYKMVNNGTLDSLGGIVSTGKEAVVIHARGGSYDDKPLPSECALKIFKTTLNEFKTRQKYIQDDHRFRDRYSKQNPRKIVKLWAEKEFRNLKRMEEAGINCPKAILLRKHILVMEFIGAKQVPALKLKEASLSPKQYQKAYGDCIEFMKTLYEKCNLIHADFSEYNILWLNHKCYFIDVSQSIEPTHPHAYHFLLRDCHNVVNFFSKIGVMDVMKVEELFEYICGKEFNDIDQIESDCLTMFERDEEMLTYGMDSTTYSFDYQFSTTTTTNEAGDDESSENES